MNPSIPEIRVGAPMQCEGLSLFPLYSEHGLLVDDDSKYVLAQEAMENNTCIVREVSEEGSVGALLVVNGGDTPVLFVEGEVMRGAKQDRAICSSVLAGGGGQTRIPVCCVERGRWEYAGRRFTPGSCCPPTMRILLKQVANAAGSGRFVGQASVWQAIRRNHQATATRSERENLSDTLDTHRDKAEDLRNRLPWPEGASGIAVVRGGKTVSVDIFEKPETLATIWGRIVDGIVVDALEAPDTRRRAGGNDLSVRLYKGRVMRWNQVETVGMGEAYRAQDDGMLAAALVLDGRLVHLGISMRST